MTDTSRNANEETPRAGDSLTSQSLSEEVRLQSELLKHERLDWIWIAAPSMALAVLALLDGTVFQGGLFIARPDAPAGAMSWPVWSGIGGLMLMAAGGASVAISLRRNRSQRLMQLKFLTLSRTAHHAADAIDQSRQ